jgi:class 3 adenylate cyclase
MELISEENAALSAAWRLQRSGNFVAALDVAQDALNSWPDSLALQHISVLALASCGSTSAALAAYRASALETSKEEDYLALEARLLKDLAFEPGADGAPGLLVGAAEAYERTAARTPGTYTRQNAALLWALAGNDARARVLADAVRKSLAAGGVPGDEESAYFYWATAAEAAFVLDDGRAVREAIAQANRLCRRNLWARTRTFAQIRRLSDIRPNCVQALGSWHLPSVGLLANPITALAETLLVTSTTAEMPALLYGTASDLEAEWAQRAHPETDLHVVLPNAPGSKPSLEPGGLLLNRQASGQAAGYSWSSLLLDDAEDPERLCAATALGLSLGLADALHAPWEVLQESAGRWRHFAPRSRAELTGRAMAGVAETIRTPRYAFLFSDAVGYSSLTAAETRRYWTKLLPETCAAVLRRHAGSVLFRKTWGDAIHAVFRCANSAARAALEMAAATARLNDEVADGRRLTFRTALHFGTADVGMDPIEEATSYFGPQLSFAARIVPVVPPGGIFVTESFAAQLSLEAATDVVCTYVGATQLAKGYGRVRLLLLMRRR